MSIMGPKHYLTYLYEKKIRCLFEILGILYFNSLNLATVHRLGRGGSPLVDRLLQGPVPGRHRIKLHTCK